MTKCISLECTQCAWYKQTAQLSLG